MVVVQNMMLQITKSFTDYLTVTFTPLLTKLETINDNNANVTANVDSCKNNNNKQYYWTLRRRRAKLRGGRQMSLFQVSHKDLMLMTWRFSRSFVKETVVETSACCNIYV